MLRYIGDISDLAAWMVHWCRTRACYL